MKQITLQIPDTKFNFFMELIRQLGINVQSEVDIPETQKNIVRERIVDEAENPMKINDWDSVKDNFKL